MLLAQSHCAQLARETEVAEGTVQRDLVITQGEASLLSFMGY